MRRPLNESARSAHEPTLRWADALVQRRGILRQGLSLRAEALCLDVVENGVLLAPITPDDGFALEPGVRTAFEVTLPSGIIRLTGILTGRQQVEIRKMRHTALRLAVDPQSVQQINRRASYRVAVSLKGQIAPLSDRDAAQHASELWSEGIGDPAARQSQLEALAASVEALRRPCVVRDLSVGGARLSMSSPPPAVGQAALLDLAVGEGGTLPNLPCIVVEGRPQVTPGPFDAQVRVRLISVLPRHEAALSRYVAGIQLEILRKGIRS